MSRAHLVRVHVLEEVQDRRVGKAYQPDDDVERREAEHFDDVAGDHGADGVRRRVRDVCYGVDRAVDADIFLGKRARSFAERDGGWQENGSPTLSTM